VATVLNGAWLGFGANLGDPAGQIRSAFGRIQALCGAPCRLSSLWCSSPVGCPPGSPDFVNAVARIAPPGGAGPREFLRTLLELESAFGARDRSRPNNPRYLDLDLLLWGDLRLDSAELILPHPRACERPFVMGPLRELDPDLAWPGAGVTVAAIAARLDFSRCRVLSA
jgi:2-amino-4-hydroxy-6-hydroxymethyldihydropteridine diphosphokinase